MAMVDETIYGTDIKNTWEVGPHGDIKTVSGLKNAEQAVYNRLMTKYDELYKFYDGYGNHDHDVIGETDKAVAENKLKIYTENCLRKEPRVEEIGDIMVTFERDVIIVEVIVKFISENKSSNLVFTLERL
ncbi:DUF2634 domain-containing protein [Methanobacterium formicicum]|uniref:DUF2634 domain-containing protein n=1 Tax=Methanobacterium formicicum TaxID=2162 RepID=A0A843ASI8_METFO|nr:DUF2634 domain-containing protein [Methanobacterium formicicum]MBF4474523.1 DUF2634 domain-containing protein [Methanobacterium formicicum]